jgi:hypothetical protein
MMIQTNDREVETKICLSCGEIMSRTPFLHLWDAGAIQRYLYARSEIPRERLERVAEFPQFLEESSSWEVSMVATPGTDEIIVRFKPSTRLENLIAALRADELDLSVGK